MMDDLELGALYTGYGYQVRIVAYGAGLPDDASDAELDRSINLDMAASFAWAMGEIKNIQSAARGGKPMFVFLFLPRFLWSGYRSLIKALLGTTAPSLAGL